MKVSGGGKNDTQANYKTAIPIVAEKAILKRSDHEEIPGYEDANLCDSVSEIHQQSYY